MRRMDQDMVIVDGCPCGAPHGVAARSAAVALETVPVATRGGQWHVPVVFLSAHDVDDDGLRAAAAEYGFTRLLAA